MAEKSNYYKDPGHARQVNWMFHPEIVKKVLEGKYNEITPYTAEFVVTTNCSNRCNICGYKPTKKIMGNWEKNDFSNPKYHMKSVDFGKSLLDKLFEAGLKGIIFTGGGEPFLHAGLEEMIKHTAENNIDFVLYSNGNSTSERRLLKVVELNPLLVRISLNAGTEEGYNRFHCPSNSKGALQRCISSIEIVAKAALQNPNMDFGVGVVVCNENEYELVEAAKRVREIKERTHGRIDYITYRPGFNYFGKEQLSAELLDKAHRIVEEEVEKVMEGTGIRVSNVTPRYKALKENTRHYTKCRGTGLFGEVAPEGTMHVCCDRNCHPDFIIGDLGLNSVKEIHSSKRRTNLLRCIDCNNCGNCPPACNPHDVNNQFEWIEEKRTEGKMNEVESFIKQKQEAGAPKMVNF